MTTCRPISTALAAVLLSTGALLPTAAALRAQDPGTLDPGFNATVDVPIQKVVLQPDGKLLIGGQFDQVNGQHRHGIARLNADGSLDPGFNPAAGDNNFAEVQSIVVQPDGRVLVAGRIYNGADAPQTQGILRLNADGTLDPGFGFKTFNANPNGFNAGVGLQPDGKVLLGGGFSKVNGATHNSVARVNADGSLDFGFNAGCERVNDIALQPDGKVVIVGNFTNVNGFNGGADHNHVARLNADGSTDAGFLGGVNLNVYGVALQPDGKIVLAGQFGLVDGVARYRLARLNPDGSLDAGVNTGPDVGLSSVALQPDGKIVIAGAFTAVNGVPQGRIARVYGTPPPAFFNGEANLGNNAYYLQFGSGNPFGYYSFLSDAHYLYHFDLGYEYVFDANDDKGGVYLYDFKSGSFFYTSPGFPFPYLYDFSLNTVLYYYPDPANPGRYNTNGTRYFYRFDTGAIFSK